MLHHLIVACSRLTRQAARKKKVQAALSLLILKLLPDFLNNSGPNANKSGLKPSLLNSLFGACKGAARSSDGRAARVQGCHRRTPSKPDWLWMQTGGRAVSSYKLATLSSIRNLPTGSWALLGTARICSKEANNEERRLSHVSKSHLLKGFHF